MAKRSGKRKGSTSRKSIVVKRKAFFPRRRKPAAKKQRLKKKSRHVSDVGVAIGLVRGCKGKNIKRGQSDVNSKNDTSIATSLQAFSDETSGSPASYPSDSTLRGNDSMGTEKGKRKRKSRKEVKQISEVSGSSKTTSNRTPRNSSKKPKLKRRRSSLISDEQTQMSKQSESGKPNESAGSGTAKQKGNDPQNTNDLQQEEPKDVKGLIQKTASKEVMEEKNEGNSSSSG